MTPDHEPLKIVFETLDPAVVPIVKSLLEGADIPFVTRGEDEYDAFRGAFRGTVFDPHGRPVTFLTTADDAEDAGRILREAELTDDA